jgi:hypothetical protein
MPKLVAAPPTADAAAKPSAPARNVILRPIRSPSRPPNSSRLPQDGGGFQVRAELPARALS